MGPGPWWKGLADGLRPGLLGMKIMIFSCVPTLSPLAPLLPFCSQELIVLQLLAFLVHGSLLVHALQHLSPLIPLLVPDLFLDWRSVVVRMSFRLARLLRHGSARAANAETAAAETADKAVLICAAETAALICKSLHE